MIINQKKNRLLYLIKGLGTLFLYFFISYIRDIPFYLLNINLEDLPEVTYKIYLLVIEVIMILLIYLIFEKEINEAIDDIKINHQKYFYTHFKTYIIGIVIMLGSNIIINFIGGAMSTNETAVRNEFYSFPITTYISAVFLAPLVEEFVFRLGIKSIIKNKILFIIISGLFFGYLHVIKMPFNILFPLYLLSYSAPGLTFAYMMSKTNNIFTSIGFHLMHNGILMSMQVFLLIFTWGIYISHFIW